MQTGLDSSSACLVKSSEIETNFDIPVSGTLTELLLCIEGGEKVPDDFGCFAAIAFGCLHRPFLCRVGITAFSGVLGDFLSKENHLIGDWSLGVVEEDV